MDDPRGHNDTFHSAPGGSDSDSTREDDPVDEPQLDSYIGHGNSSRISFSGHDQTTLESDQSNNTRNEPVPEVNGPNPGSTRESSIEVIDMAEVQGTNNVVPPPVNLSPSKDPNRAIIFNGGFTKIPGSRSLPVVSPGNPSGAHVHHVRQGTQSISYVLGDPNPPS